MSATASGPRRAPGPKGHWLLGSLPERRDDPLGLYSRGRAQHGDVVRYRFGPIALHLISHPDGIKHVLVDNAANYIKGRVFDDLRPLLGNGLVSSEGDFWKRQRRLAQPSFHRERLAALAEQMVDVADATLASWAPRVGSELDVAEEMTRLTFSIVGRTLFSVDWSGDAREAREYFDAANTGVMDRALSVLKAPLFVPTQKNRRLNGSIAALDGIVRDLIAGRRSQAPAHPDLLSTLMEAADADSGERMTDAQLRDEVVTLMFAGHDTTSSALAFAFHLLARHPQWRAQLEDEVDTVLQGKRPSAADVPRLTRCTLALQETMRLYPPAWLLIREALEDDVIGGFHIPRKTLIGISPHVVHRHPDLWDEPDTFRPERFLPEAVARRPKHAYLPFGAGQRQCIGSNFAMLEATLVLARVLQTYRLERVGDAPLDLEALITLKPKGPMPMRLEVRSGR